jgi:hypothetical protein
VRTLVVNSATSAVGVSLRVRVAELADLGALVAAMLCLIAAISRAWIIRRPRSFSFGLFAR